MALVELLFCFLLTLFALGSTNPFGRYYAVITQPTNACVNNPTEPQIAMSQASVLQHYLNGILNNNCDAGHMNQFLLNRLCNNPFLKQIVESRFGGGTVDATNRPTSDLYRPVVDLNAIQRNSIPNVVNNYIIVTPDLLRNVTKKTKGTASKRTDFKKSGDELKNSRRNSERSERTRNGLLKNMALKSQTSDEIDEITNNLNEDDRKIISAFVQKYPEVPEHVVIALLPSLKSHLKRNSTFGQEARYALPYGNFGDWMSYWTHNFPLWYNYHLFNQQYFDNLHKQHHQRGLGRSVKQIGDYKDNSVETYREFNVKTPVKTMINTYDDRISPIPETVIYKRRMPDKRRTPEKIINSRSYQKFVPHDEVNTRDSKSKITEELVSNLYSEPKTSYLREYRKNNYPNTITYGTNKNIEQIFESPTIQPKLSHEDEILHIYDNRISDKVKDFDIERNINFRKLNTENRPHSHIEGETSRKYYDNRNYNTYRTSDVGLLNYHDPVRPTNSYVVSKDSEDIKLAEYRKERSSIEKPKKINIVMTRKLENMEPVTVRNDVFNYEEIHSLDRGQLIYHNHKHDDHINNSEKSIKTEGGLRTAIAENLKTTYSPLQLKEVNFETKPIQETKPEEALRKPPDESLSPIKSMDRITRESITKPMSVETVQAHSKVAKYPLGSEFEKTQEIPSIARNSSDLNSRKEKKHVVVVETISPDLEEFWRRRGRVHKSS